MSLKRAGFQTAEKIICYCEEFYMRNLDVIKCTMSSLVFGRIAGIRGPKLVTRPYYDVRVLDVT
jgi:hypothetical protein